MPAKDAGGLSTTLYNLFDGYPTSNISYLQFNDETTYTDQTPLTNNIYYGKVRGLSYQSNRLGKYINSLINYLNFSYRHIFNPILIYDKNFKTPDYILVCTSGPIKLQLAYLLRNKCKKGLITYFMDDWPSYSTFSWIGSNTASLIKHLQGNSIAQIYISEELKKVFSLRYSIDNLKYFVVHNPVKLIKQENDFELHKPENAKKPKKIIYAGSIWPMHADAILLFAEAVESNDNTDFQLQFDIYCPKIHWDQYFSNSSNKKIQYKGFLKYDEVSKHLLEASILLISSSFDKDYYSISLSSIQTKTTDYMLAKRPIFFIGPDYAATNKFIKKWDCGYYFNEFEVSKLQHFISKILSNQEELNQKGLNGYTAVKENFTKDIVQKKLYQFLATL